MVGGRQRHTSQLVEVLAGLRRFGGQKVFVGVGGALFFFGLQLQFLGFCLLVDGSFLSVFFSLGRGGFVDGGFGFAALGVNGFTFFFQLCGAGFEVGGKLNF